MRRTGASAVLLGLTSIACTVRPVDDSGGTGTGTTADPGSTGAPTSGGAGTSGDVPAETTAVTTSETTQAGTSSSSTVDASTGDATTGDATTGETMPLACPPAIDAAIAACVADLQAEPELGEGLFLLDLLRMCGDAEPVADDYDQHCAAMPGDPICALDYPVFVAEVLPMCVDRVQQQLFADVCLLPERYDQWLFTPSIALMQRRQLVDVGGLSAGEMQQLVAAGVDMGFAVEDAAAALLAADNGSVEQLTVLDVGTDRAMTAYVGLYGGVQRGRVFFRGTTVVVGAVEEGLFFRCGVERGVEGQACVQDVDCAPDHVCNDVLQDQAMNVLMPGACIGPGGLPGEGMDCATHDDCVPANGLLCMDTLLEDGTGTCRPGWQRRSFAGADTALTMGGSVVVEILVAGVATVPTAAYLDLSLTQATANLLAVRLINPGGTESAVAMTGATSFVLDLAPVPTPGDESAGGVWTLVIDDVGGQASGTIAGATLTLDTRWD